MKKAEVAGQILIYVLAIIVFSLTLLYGYKAVKYFTERGTEISYLQLESDIKSEIEKVKGDTFGTVKKKVLTIQGDYKDICFVKSFPSFPDSISTITYALIRDHISSKANDKNMFLAPPGDKSFNVGDITVTDTAKGFDCINIRSNKATLRLESMGNHVKVSEWK